ncbi:NAD-dependent epimerase/dehydratase family protein [Nonomuraea glycinis]|uniref:NAD-dependent epimerase/dehydratase family protein n=1 Tax=Nonomuraea glycinis TaxID=2047744 RepID=UPI0033A6D1AD
MASLLNGPARSAPVAVIGAPGFIGSRLVPGLRAATIPTFSFGRHSPYLRGGRATDGLLSAHTVFYLATSITPAVAERNPDLVEADRAAFLSLLDEVGATDRRPVVVLTSSGGTAYDPDHPAPYSEQSPVRPTSRYGMAKLRLEEDLLSRHETIRPVVLRLSNVYGPRQRSWNGLGVIPHWLEAIAERRPLRVLGDPETSRDYVYVDDTVEAMIRVHLTACASDDELPPVLNIGSGVPVTLRQLLSVLTDVIGFKPRTEQCERRSFDRAMSWLDVRQAAGTLGWRPRTPLRTGLEESWWAAQAELSRSHPQLFSRR